MKKRFRRTVVTGAVLAAIVGVPLLLAQAPGDSAAKPSFEVASVKLNKSGDGRIMIGLQPGGRVTATNVTLRLLMRQAYQVQDFQIVGGPGWLNSDHFDIVAKADDSVQLQPVQPGGPPGPMQLMMQSLLEDRFKLSVRHEMREMPIYALVMARRDGKPGPQLKASTVDCAALMASARGRGTPPPPAPGSPADRPPCGFRIGPGQMTGGAMPLSQLANALSNFVQRTVEDRTRLTGSYDLELKFTPDQLTQGQPPPGAPAPPPIDPNGPSIYTALQEQLGLKLESTKGQVDVLVIDRAEPPVPD